MARPLGPPVDGRGDGLSLATFERKVGKAITQIGAAALAAVMLAAHMVWAAWCATWLWQWHVAPLFALPVLTLWQMLGLILTVYALRFRSVPVKTEPHEKWWVRQAPWIGPPLLVAIGYAARVLQ